MEDEDFETDEPISLLEKTEIDYAKRRHYCKADNEHVIEKGSWRLKVLSHKGYQGRPKVIYYCVECATKILEQDIAQLKKIAEALAYEE